MIVQHSSDIVTLVGSAFTGSSPEGMRRTVCLHGVRLRTRA